MIKHVVLFKLKDNSPENLAKTKEILLSMKDNVAQVREIEVGVDFLQSERSYDIGLFVTLDSEQALADYQEDKYHCEVVKTHMHAVRESSIAIDYHI